MTKISLRKKDWGRVVAYVCLSVGVLSIAQIPVIAVAQVDTPNEVCINDVSPLEGPAGTVVTIDGSGFTAINEVHFGPSVVSDVSSDGETIVFTVPEGVIPGLNYHSSVEASNGINSTCGSGLFSSGGFDFMVTEADQDPVAPVITAIDPTSGLPGSLVQVTGTGFGDSNVVNFGSMAPITGLASTQGGTVLSFSVPNDAVTDITYGVTVTNDQDLTSNSIDFQVINGNNQSEAIELSALSPSHGPVSTEVYLTGKGFTAVTERSRF